MDVATLDNLGFIKNSARNLMA